MVNRQWTMVYEHFKPIWACPKRVGLSVPIFLPSFPISEDTEPGRGKKDFHFNPSRKPLLGVKKHQLSNKISFLTELKLLIAFLFINKFKKAVGIIPTA